MSSKKPTRNQISAWKRKVRKVDNDKCRITGVSNATIKKYPELRGWLRLEVHHLEDASSNPVLATEVSNGITLLRPLHVDFHRSMGGFRTPTHREDFEKWLKNERVQTLIQNYKSLGRVLYHPIVEDHISTSIDIKPTTKPTKRTKKIVASKAISKPKQNKKYRYNYKMDSLFIEYLNDLKEINHSNITKKRKLVLALGLYGITIVPVLFYLIKTF